MWKVLEADSNIMPVIYGEAIFGIEPVRYILEMQFPTLIRILVPGSKRISDDRMNL